jgi:hypothetical protein
MRAATDQQWLQNGCAAASFHTSWRDKSGYAFWIVRSDLEQARSELATLKPEVESFLFNSQHTSNILADLDMGCDKLKLKMVIIVKT